jgi:hypothetical protein
MINRANLLIKQGKQKLKKQKLKFMKKMFMMAAIVTILIACKKSDAPPPAPTAVGYWKGSETEPGGTANLANAFILKADGSLKYYYRYNVDTANAFFKTTGKYELVNNTFKAIIYISNNSTTIAYTYQGTINSGLTKVENGTWGFENNITNGGKFYIDKQ